MSVLDVILRVFEELFVTLSLELINSSRSQWFCCYQSVQGGGRQPGELQLSCTALDHNEVSIRRVRGGVCNTNIEGIKLETSE